jgi:AcrR family transcriptional regulator
LLGAAERLIRVRGPQVSLDAIATEAGVTKPILYRGVGDRDALVEALAQRLFARMLERLTMLVEHASHPRDALHRTVGGYLELASEERNLYMYVTAGGTSDDRLRQSLLLTDRAAGQFADRMAADHAYREARGIDAATATAWSYGIVGALHYVTLWWLRESTIDAATVAEHLTDLLWSGLAAN